MHNSSGKRVSSFSRDVMEKVYVQLILRTTIQYDYVQVSMMIIDY